ncbi:MAG: polyphosphate polymerase domain-containing protein [Candidatus Eisenbacteria bacterium]
MGGVGKRGGRVSRILETKYVFMEAERDGLIAWLGSRLLPDRRFPFGRIVTLYYDTPSLDFYYQKRNGDYIKAKVRLRWYDAADPGDEGGTGPASAPVEIPCFFEVKGKCGALREKERLALRLPDEALRTDPLHHPAVAGLTARLPELSFRAPGPLVPVVEIRYDRRRFVDPASGTRVALDTAIRCTRANGQLIPGIPPVRLGVGVLELKGNRWDAPRALGGLGLRLTRESFSKYGRCCDALTQPLAMRT